MSGPTPDLARAHAFRAGGPGPAARRGERGAVTWVTLLLCALVVGGAYLGVVWFPIYYENYGVRQIVRDYMNQAVKNRDDERLRQNMVAKIHSFSQVEVLDERGRPARVPAVPVEEHEILWERDTSSQPPMLRVAFEYERQVTLPLLERVTTKVFTIDLTNDLTIPDWGPAR